NTTARAGNIAGLVHELQVVHTDVADRTLIQLRLANCTHQCGVAAIARTIDTDAIGRRHTLLDRPFGRIGEIVLHLRAPLLVAGRFEVHAVAAAAAEIDL